MRIAVGLGWLLIAVALASLAWDLYFVSIGGPFRLSYWGEFWYVTHSSSLVAVKSGVERHLSPALWAWTMAPLLEVPTLPLFGLPGLVLATLPWSLARLRAARAPRQA